MRTGIQSKLFFIILLKFSIKLTNANNEIDPLGYIVYCPCMGRFGNQADHFLGSLGFAHSINRTLVLPPWVEYRQRELTSHQIPFDTYFNVPALAAYHRVITMIKFMETIAPTIWPPEKRISFCYMHRESLKGNKGQSCNAKEGNPFGPFWNTFQIDFVQSEYFAPLSFDGKNLSEDWNTKYPAEAWPVLAFTGAPASFPVNKHYRELHKYLVWSDSVKKQATDFIQNTLNGEPFIGVHLRNGIDWIRACEHIISSPNLFSAAQCLGYHNEHGNATKDMCLPSKDIILKQIRFQIKNFKEKHLTTTRQEIRTIFVASDSNHMIDDLNRMLRRLNVTAHKLSNTNPHVDLVILGQSDHFIGNCISSFTAFAVRERTSKQLPVSFWAFPIEQKTVKQKKDTSQQHTEL